MRVYDSCTPPAEAASVNSEYSTTMAIIDEEYDLPAFITDTPYVLVIDDDPAILSVVMLLLETEGYAALGFSDSQKVFPFLEYVKSMEKVKGLRLPSVILLDLMMPHVSGYDIAAWLSEREWIAHVPIVIMTANHRIAGASAIPGATDLISKPFQIHVLISALEKYMCSQ